MKKLFNKTFFKFAFGFLGIITTSVFLVFYIAYLGYKAEENAVLSVQETCPPRGC